MIKPLLVLAFVACMVFITPTEGTSYSSASASAYASYDSEPSRYQTQRVRCTGPHEYFSCRGACDNVCRTLSKQNQTHCPIATFACVPMCYCEAGYARDDNNICIPIKNCKDSCAGDPNALPGCGVNCGRHCSDIGKGPMACPAICFSNGCDCKPGFVVDGNIRKCVRPNECTPTCAKNEVFSNCTNGGCGPKTCDGLGQKIGCVKMDQRYCKEGCICKKGYLRNNDRECIPKTECPECGGDPNAVSGCGVNCGRHCSDIGKARVSCLKICYNDACDCRRGFVYDNNIRKCVRPIHCTATCGIHEIFSTCVNGGCNAKNCAQLGRPVPCVKPKICYSGCLCKPGWLRADNGICVPEDQCPKPQCADHETYAACPGNSCIPQTCSQLGFPLNCSTSSESDCPGQPGCICNNGNVRDCEGNCIPKDQCPSCGGDPNAVSGCGNYCGKRCSDYKNKIKFCPLFCLLNGCTCRDGFVYDDNLKKCVSPKDCTPTCGINEVYDSCANGGCRKWNCSLPKLCIDPIKCKAGCSCQDGYTRATNGTCIPENQCPEPQCADDETYATCPENSCIPQTCTQLGFPLNCSFSSDSDCPGQPGCICNNGNVRDFKGNCISKDQCPSCGGDPNAVSGCGNYCGKRCSDYKNKESFCPLFCLLNGCACRDGFVYDDNLKKCVSPQDCTPTCGNNEVYDFCANGGCRKWNCSLPKICRDPIKCTAGCSCQNGYTRAINGTCIPEDQCPEHQCGPNERFEKCPDTLCSPQKCSQLGFPIACKASTLPATNDSDCSGTPSCICDYGYVRDIKGNCIPEENCPSCGGDPNAVKGCGINCGRLCSNYNKGPVPCPRICKVNSCDCRKGFVLDQNTGKCVQPEECTPICSNNEIYSDCINGGCQRKNCSELGKSVPCIKLDPKHCIKGCLCKDNYLRAENGTCIPENQCQSTCTKPNEVYDSCPPVCPPQTCESIDKKYSCPMIPVNSTDYCSGDCRCVKGYYRNKMHECISEENCRKCTGPNEYFSCGGACDNVCATLSEQNQTNCPIINIKCNPMCYCREGYARDNKNICIPIKDCHAKCTKPNEVYDPCPPVCPPQSCESIDKKYNCPMIPVNSTNHCSGDCRCVKGYYRNKMHECISEENCRKCTGPNEYFSCGGACDNVCETLSKQNQTNCPIINIKCNPMCYCREGYARDNKNVCIPIEDCHGNLGTFCGPNERYEKKPSYVCEPLECSELGFPIDCPPVEDTNCDDEPGCICSDGYVRNHLDQCVKKSQCPSCGGDPNAMAGCGVNCGKTCSTYGQDVACIDICYTNGCDCKVGFVYDEVVKKCVKYENCSKTTTSCGGDPNAVAGCGVNCGKTCSTYGQDVACIDICYPNGCDCKDGFVFDDVVKKCVKYENCSKTKTSCGGDPNAVAGCGVNCGKTCSTYGQDVACIDICYPNGCDCKDGFVFDDVVKKCVKYENCSKTKTSCGGDPNAVAGCGVNCGKTCSTYGQDVACIDICYPNGCDCKDGFVFDDVVKKCVKYENCSKTKTSCGGDPNAVAGCGVNCGKTCSTYGQDVACIDICYPNGCDCKDGFVFDDVVKKCVKYENCSKTNSGCDFNITEAKERHYKGSIALSGEFIYQLCQSQPDNNFVTSATSILVPLAQIGLFAQNLVLKQLLTVHNLNSKDEIKCVYLDETSSYKNQKQVEFELATKYYVNEDYTLDGNFISVSKKYVCADGENVNFGQSEQAAATINNWVSNKTHNRIQDLVSSGSLNANTVVVLVNAVYFMGDWIHQFNPNNTEKRDFTKRNNVIVQLDTMYQKNTFKYAATSLQGLNIQALEMPYKNDNFSFFMILPDLEYFDHTVLALRDPENFINIYNSLRFEEVQVFLPKIKIDTQIDAAEMLQKVGVTEMFSDTSDGFQGILKVDQPLYVSSAVQKAFIKVDETGTEAAAASALGFSALSVLLNPPPVFKADHPFLFYIILKKSILFCGVFVG